MWNLLGTGERKFIQMVQITWPEMAAMPIYGINLKNLFLRNQKADDLETWHAALGA